MSESEESADVPKKKTKEELEAPAEAGAVIAERANESEPAADTKLTPKKEGANVPAKPSNTLFVRNMPEDMDASEMEMRLTRFGDLVSLTKEGEGEAAMFVAKFVRTNSAYEAREKLDGTKVDDAVLQVEFGPQDADHYSRGKKRTQGRGKKEVDGDGADAEAKSKGMRAWQEDGGGEGEPTAKRRKTDEEPVKPRAIGSLEPPAKAISKWAETCSFEEQLEDFMKMPRRGMYNRYLVLGKLPPELRTGTAIWNMVAPVQRDIMHIEMLTCFGKPVAHVALRSATAAAAMHRIAEQLYPNLTVAFAPPRKASKALWLGNIDDFVNRKDLETVLGTYGKLVNGMNYLPARTCAFATFSEVAQAVKARNSLYGLEVQKNQYLNVDFVDEWTAEQQEGAFGMPGQMPWGMQGMPPMGPWGGAPPWGMPTPPWQQPPSKGGRKEQQRMGMPPFPGMPMPPGYPGMPGYPPPPGGDDRDGKRRRSRSARRRDASEEPPARKGAKAAPAGKRAKEAPAPAARAASDSEGAEAPPKTKVKLYKMGEFCCNIVANFVKGKDDPDPISNKLHIDQRTKIDHCKSHMDRAGALSTIWHFSAADRKDCAAYDALCDYFVEKERVGLVQTPACYVYIVPPTEKYLKALKLPSSNFVVGIQIPIKK